MSTALAWMVIYLLSGCPFEAQETSLDQLACPPRAQFTTLREK